MSERRATILHVDDDEANRYAVTRSLTKAGFEVIEAADGAGALRALARQPDLAILDIRLPDISGFEVCRRLKQDPATADIPVLHLSASFVRGEDKALGLDGGADAYLVRPVEPVELIATVNALLRTRHTEEKLRASERRFRDQTERLNAALAASDTGTFRYDLTRNVFAEFDEHLRRLFEFAPDAPLTGADIASRAHPDDVPAIRAAIAACREGKHCEIEFRVILPDGSIRWLFDRAKLGPDETGQLNHLVGACTDVTARKAVEQELRRVAHAREQLLASEQALRAEAERASQMKDEFLATLSHELRTPLSAILGWSQILRRGSTKAETLDEGLKTIERNARAQTQIIEDLLDMNRIVSGRIHLDSAPIDAAAVIVAAVDTVYPAANAKGIRIEFNDRSRRPILGDFSRLQQVFWNVLSNAVKFTPRGGLVRIEIDLADAFWRVEITDDGEGIAPEFLPHVFDRFRQADASTTRRHGGLGLGLAIVKQLVELHGGSVAARSAGAGKGTTLSVLLPVNDGSRPTGSSTTGGPIATHQQIASAENVRPSASTPAAAAIAGTAAQLHAAGVDSATCDELKHTSVLIIDDEPDARALLKHLLEQCGVRVLVTASVDEAVACVERERPDAIVSDIGMPGEDGYSLLRRVRSLGEARGGETPAIALTAYARAEDRVTAIRAGFQAHLPKPIDAAELIATVGSIVRRRRTAR